MKLVTVAIFSHLSDHIPAIKPIAPIEKDDRNKKIKKIRAFSRWISIKILNTKIDKKLIIIEKKFLLKRALEAIWLLQTVRNI